MCDIPEVKVVVKKRSLWRFLYLRIVVGKAKTTGLYFVGWKKVFGFNFNNDP